MVLNHITEVITALNSDTNRKADLAVAMVESRAVHRGLKPTVTACYSIEGDSPMVLSADEIFKRVEESLVPDNLSRKSLSRPCP